MMSFYNWKYRTTKCRSFLCINGIEVHRHTVDFLFFSFYFIISNSLCCTQYKTIHCTFSKPSSESNHVHKSTVLRRSYKLKLFVYINYLIDQLIKGICLCVFVCLRKYWFVAQFFHLPFFAGNCPVASRYLFTRSSWTDGRQGWYRLYSIVYSPFPYGNNRKAWTYD